MRAASSIERIPLRSLERQTRDIEERMNSHPIAAHADAEWDERDILSRLRAGDEIAFELLVRRYSGRLLSVARRLVRDEEDARDTVQDALLSAFRSIHRFEGGSQLGTWLHRIVVNAGLMRLRSRKRHPECSIDELLPVFGPDGHRALRPEEEAGADVQLEREQLRTVVRQCVELLPGGYRETYLLRDVEELSTEDTAAALGISPNAVKIRLHRARQALMTLVRARVCATAPGRTR
jgi:RNA polymerase sigma-70 factor (ECF subfamily)